MTEENKEQKVNFTKDDVPSEKDQEELKSKLRGILNPDGKNEQMDEYINSTFNYIGNLLNKVASADDKDKASNDIAEDIVGKLKNWAESKQKETEGESSAEASEKKE